MATDSSPLSTQPIASRRLTEIDGIRGWAAISVLVQHFVLIFGVLYPPLAHPDFIMMNGMLAVQVFFILSGDALSSGFFQNNDIGQLHRLVLKRYPRLTFPILISCFTVFLVSSAGFNFLAMAVTPLHKHQAWTGASPTDFYYMLYYSFIRVYLELPTSLGVYHPFLWTMSIELIGSFLVFSYLYLYKKLNFPFYYLVGITSFAFAFFPMYAGFFLGMILGWLRQRGGINYLLQSSCWQVGSTICLFSLVALSDFIATTANIHLRVLLALTLLGGVYSNRWLLSFFRNRVSQFLGALSFPLYVMHFAVLISITSYLIIWFDKNGGLSAVAVSLIILASFISSFAAAWLLRQIEIPYLRKLGVLVDYMLRGRDGSRQS